MGKKFDYHWIFVGCLLALAGILAYRHGAFGNFYIEQEVWKDQSATWVWHKMRIVTSELEDAQNANDSTFPRQLRKAEQEIEQIKKAEKFVP